MRLKTAIRCCGINNNKKEEKKKEEENNVAKRRERGENERHDHNDNE